MSLVTVVLENGLWFIRSVSGLLLAGPYDTKLEAETDHVGSMFLFRSKTSQVFEPAVITRPESVSLSSHVRVDSFVKIEGGAGVVLGRYVHIASFAHLNIGGGLLTMAEGSCVASGARIITGSAKPGIGRSCSACHPDVVNMQSSVRIGKNATVFAGATVLPGCVLHEGAVLGAGSVLVAGSVMRENEVWVGNPARRVAVTR